MDITFLLGNGFDIGLGLNSGYRDFYKEYCKPDHNDTNSIRKFKKQLESSDDEIFHSVYDWSDFEKAFGEYAKEFGKEQKEEYLEVFSDFCQKFNLYLEKEENLIDYSDKKAITEMMCSLCQCHYQLKETERRNIEKVYNLSSSHTYNFITFNYTSTLDNCFSILKESKTLSGTIGKCIHIHGRILEGMTVGINDPSQISNSYFASDSKVIQALVKSNQIEIMGSNSKAELLRLINESKIIYVFGMSIGVTDKVWWETIGEWLKKDSDHRLVILTYVPGYTDRLPSTRNSVITEYKNRFFTQAEMTEDIASRITKQIIIGINLKIFGKKLKKPEEIAAMEISDSMTNSNAVPV